MNKIHIEYPGYLIEGELLACGINECDGDVLVKDSDGLVWAHLDIADYVCCDTDDFHHGGYDFNTY